MTISGADFELWVRRDAPDAVLLVELAFAYEASSVMTEGTVYLSRGSYFSKPTDTPPNVGYRDVVRSISSIESAIDLATQSGETEFQVGSVELDAVDGSVDFLLDLIVDGRTAAFYWGARTWDRSDFRKVAEVAVQRITAPDERRMVIEVVDKRLLMDVSVQGAAIASGPEAGKLNPLIYGGVYNSSPRSLNSTDNTYQVLENYDATSYLAEVRDAGAVLGNEANGALFSGDNTALTANAGTDTLTFVGHGLADNDVVLPATTGTVFAGMTAGTRYWVINVAGNDWQLSTSRGGSALDISGTTFSGTMSFKRFRYMNKVAVDGTIQLSTTPAGQITLDVQQAVPGETNPFDLARRLIDEHTEIATADIDTTAFDDADTALYARLGSKYVRVGFEVKDRLNLVPLLNGLLAPIGGWYGVDYDGVVRAGIMDLANLQSETAEHELVADDILGEVSCENLPIHYGGFMLNAARNWTVQPDGLATSLTEAALALYRREFRSQYNDGNGFVAPSSAYLPNWWASHRTAIPVVRDSVVADQIDVGAPVSTADTEICTERIEDAKPWHKAVRVRVGMIAYNWRLGSVVEFTFPRFGFDAGWNFRLAGRAVDFAAGEMVLTLLTQVTPDYTTSSYA